MRITGTLFTAALILFLACLTACKEEIPVPKPRAYPRILFPERSYKPFSMASCPMQFSMPAYAFVEKDTSFFQEKPPHPCWFNLNVPAFGATIHCSYSDIRNRQDFDKLVDDCFRLAYKHDKKADYIEDLRINKSKDVQGFVFNIEGPSASPFQFFVTDSTRHFLRGALYFNARSNPDSLAPALEFMKTDIMEMINSFEWK